MAQLLPRALTSSIGVSVSPQVAFDFMADGMKQTHWALGSMDRRKLHDGIFVGTSRWTFEPLYVDVRSDRDLLLVDYYGGNSAEVSEMRWLVSARIVPGRHCYGESRPYPDGSLIVMTVWRGPDTTDEKWNLTQHVWPTEIALIGARSA